MQFMTGLLFSFLARRNRDENLIQHECLSYEELPKPGTLVAIDAEFVSMQQVRFVESDMGLRFHDSCA
jgi:hypothetical protein